MISIYSIPKKHFRTQTIFQLWHIWILGIMLSSCSNTKYLPEGEFLYTGADVKIESEDKSISRKQQRKLSGELEDLTKPEPNSTFLGFLRPQLWIYNIVGKPKRPKGLRAFIRNKLGEPPVLFSQVEPERNRELLKNHLENKGYFQAQVSFEIKEAGKRKRKMEYTADVLAPYMINRVIWPDGPDTISNHIRNATQETLLKAGDQYSLDLLKQERERIDEALKNQGFFYFSPDFILFRVDSAIGSRKVDVFVTLKKDLPAKVFRVYTINEVTIYTNFSLDSDSSRLKRMETVHAEDLTFVRRNAVLRARPIARSVFLRRGNVYTNNNYKLTLSRLMSMDVFKFVNIRFTEPDSNGNKLDANIYLTQMPRRTIRLELRGVSKSNNFVGPEFSSTFKNRNLLRGAELFSLNLNAGFETLVGGQQSGVNSYTLGAEARLELPRFLLPFPVHNYRSQEVPKTIFRTGFELISRVDYFDMASLNFSYGYAWNETRRKKHELFPVVVNYLTVTHTSDRFEQLLNDNLFLQRSFQKQFILGLTYSFTYDTHLDERENKNNLFFNATADLSGNAFYLVKSLISDEKSTDEKPYEFLNVPFSQYSRLTFDVRHYLQLDKRSQLASRILTGIGIPYGNSSIMPYVKQFFIGGNSSVRAFQVRTLGPGTYRTPDSVRRNFLVDQAGDLKLEGNLEYRFPIYGIFKGAVFTDAGNIWLLHEDPNRPGGEFNPSKFLNQLAVGTGAGLRVDASFFVLRLDLAFPLRKPFLPENERWVADEINFGKPEWRQDNLVLNIAIGYPF